ncbi:hypothetical protein HN51_001560, partial [Arachis hypogaea]
MPTSTEDSLTFFHPSMLQPTASFYNDDERCINSLREKVLLVDDLSCVEEDEEDLNPKVGLDCIADPGKLRVVESRVLGMVRNEFGVKGNIRSTYEWKGLKLAVDETSFDFGTLYKIDYESADSNKAKQIVKEFL